jgi:hypothetical protein
MTEFAERMIALIAVVMAVLLLLRVGKWLRRG